MSNKAKAEGKKNEGNEFFKAKNYQKAIEKYSEAIEFDPSQHTYLSNRSASYYALGMFEQAAEDGKQCVRLDRTFMKGYHRAGSAMVSLKQYDDAMALLRAGIAIDPRNQDLKGLVKEIETIQRNQKIQSAIESSEISMKERDYASAFKTLDNALRIDSSNDQLNKMMDRVKPLYEQQEKKRRSGLSRTEQLKEQGDDMYKGARFEEAIVKYTECLNSLTDTSSELALKCFGNRAACYKQISNFDGIISDCSHILEHKPDDVKSLIRRAQAFEAVERYRYALQDVRAIMNMPAEVAGAANQVLANGMQHRLLAVVNQLKKGEP